MESWTVATLGAVVLAGALAVGAPRFRVRALMAASVVCGVPVVMGRFHVALVPAWGALLAMWAVVGLVGPGRTRLAQLLAGASALLLVMAVGLAHFLPVFGFPDPTGPHTVGTRTFLLADRLPAQVWYPSDSPSGNALYLVDGQPAVAALARVFGLPGPALRHFRRIETPAQLDAPVSAAQPSFPVLLFSHGLGGFRAQNTFQVLDLASHGYIVVAVDHPGYAAAAIVRGDVIPNGHADLAGEGVDVLDAHIDAWVANLVEALDALPDIASALDHRLDLTRVGAFGHSFGGSAAYRFLVEDGRVAAAINMDGGIFGGTRSTPKPFLSMNSSETLDIDAFAARLDGIPEARVVELTGRSRDEHLGNFNELLERRASSLANGAYSMLIPGIRHIGFTDAAYYSPLFAEAGNPHAAIREVSLAFFDRYLRDRGDAFHLGALSERHPGIELKRHDP